MSEKSREEEKLSFKEQILRDLEKVKGYDEVLKEDEAVVRTPANEPSAEELMADSLSTVEEIMRKAPTVPTHPSQGVPASPADEIQRETPWCSKSSKSRCTFFSSGRKWIKTRSRSC